MEGEIGTLKAGILHPQLTKVLAELRHRDTIITGDVGLPIPKGVECVDLGWRPDDPVCLDVPEEVLKYIVVEGAVFADEALTATPDFHKKTLELLPQGLPVKYIPHTELRERSKDVRAIILAGGFIRYTSVILMAGCAY